MYSLMEIYMSGLSRMSLPTHVYYVLDGSFYLCGAWSSYVGGSDTTVQFPCLEETAATTTATATTVCSCERYLALEVIARRINWDML